MYVIGKIDKENFRNHLSDLTEMKFPKAPMSLIFQTNQKTLKTLQIWE